MKCPYCDGLGYVFVNHTDCHFNMVCPKCKGRKEIDENGNPILTNEEWFTSLSTEEKAKWIAKQNCDGCNDEPYDDKHGTCKYCMTKKTEQIREWLKQPHRGEP